MDESTLVLPSARAIRYEQLQIQSDTLFLPSFLTMSEFISKLCIVDGFKILDDDSRVLLLLEASDFKEFSNLQIERNFFTFTKNSSYIFKFFEEISAELYDIDTLDLSDIYAEYEEHITILQELYKRYEKLCIEKKLLDKIFLPKLYTFNKEYLQSHSSIEVKIDGHLTNFELELLEQCTKYININIVFISSEFNTKMQNKFNEMGIELDNNYKYLISLNTKEVLVKSLVDEDKNIICESFSESLLQVAFIKQQVYQYVKAGYKAENIAVILPDEKIAALLKSFDEKGNFNFAMGESYTSSRIYKKLNATLQAINTQTKENNHRLNRIGDDVYEKVLAFYYKTEIVDSFLEFLIDYKELFSNKTELKIFEEEVYSFKNILPFMRDMSGKSLLSLFLQRLSQRTIDDVRGGKITVMGVLETRSVSFDAVIIVDFNDANVPKKSDKDMFLNSSIREIANLPTMSDRENLQKHYYKMLINSSKAVSISYVNGSENKPSRFLKQLGIKETQKHLENEFANILFKKNDSIIYEDKEIIAEYSFKDKKLSATKLKTYLSCKRKFYYKNIRYLDSHEIPKDIPKEYEIGLNVHSALKELYSKKNSYSNVDELKRDLARELDEAQGETELDRYLISLQKKRMEIFCENEIKRFDAGWSVLECEKNLDINFAGMRLNGQIDRIDKRNNEIEVLDYKTGSYTLNTKNNFTESVDFQLEFYYLLASGYGNVSSCGFYDLKESKIVLEPFLKEKLAILESHLKDLQNIEEINFEKCEDTKHCLFCEYKIICGRE